MAHELIIRANGTASMAFRGETPWHGLGAKLEGNVTLADILRAVPEFQDPVDVEKVFTADGVEIPDSFVTRRRVSRNVLGVVGKRFHPTQDIDALSIGEDLVATGDFKWETAGVLFEGKRIWFALSANLEGEVVKGDTVKGYVTLAHAHDGTLSHHFGLTPVRVVCANTEAAARNNTKSVFAKVAHTKNSAVKLDRIAEALAAAKSDFAATLESFKALTKIKATKDDVRKLVNAVFPAPKATAIKVNAPALNGVGIDGLLDAVAVQPASDEFDRSLDILPETSRERIFADVYEYVESGKGSEIPGVAGTMWGAYNGITEYLSHGRGRNEETRLNSQLFGASATANAIALDRALNFGKW